MADGLALLKRYDTLKHEASTHWKHCEEMTEFVAPSRAGILSKRSPGQRQNRTVFDSTTTMAAEMMAHFITSYTVNPSQQWGAMRGRTDDEAMAEWFEEARDLMLADFANSMFYAEVPEMNVDWCGFGTGCLITDEAPFAVHRTQAAWRGSHYETMMTGRFVGADGPDGLTDTLMYEKSMTADQIRRRWPQATLPEKIARCLKEGKPDERFTIVHAILPRSLADQRYAAGAKKMPYASCWIETESKQVIHESGYPDFPAAVPRYLRTPGEFYGRGRGHLAYPDTWTLNTIKRMSLEDLALKTKPPILHRHDSVIGTLRLTPGGPTSINTHGGPISDSIQAFQTGSHPEVTAIKEEELRKSIRQIFFVDQILMLMEVNKSEMTAFEFAKKMELLFRQLGPVYGRQRKELLERLWHIKFVQMFHAGAFPEPPPSFFEDGAEYDIVFENPLERAQRTTDADAMALVAQDFAPWLPIYPQMTDWLDADALSKMFLKTRGVSARVTNTTEQVAATRDERLAQQQQEQQLAEAGQLAEAAGHAAPMLQALQGGRSR